MKILNSYINGNHRVIIYDNGTKIKETGFYTTDGKWVETDDDHFTYDFPENFDIKITGYCDAGCKYCFPANTPVLMADNSIKNIEDILINDKVKSFNNKSNQIEINSVINLYKRNINETLYIFTLENGEVFKCTGNHPIYTKTGKKRADEITINDDIISIADLT